MRSYVMFLLALNALVWLGMTLLLWLGGQGVAGFVATCFLLLSLHTVHAFELYSDEMEDL